MGACRDHINKQSEIERNYSNATKIIFMTEKQIRDLGWVLVKQYTHDEFRTNRYYLGCMEIEFTYEGDELVSLDMSISELIGMPLDDRKIILLTELIGNWK